MAVPKPTTLRVHVLIDSLTWGGAESLLADLARTASSAGISLSVGYLQDIEGSPSLPRLRDAGVEPVLVGTGRLTAPSSFARVRRHLANIRPDLVHTHLDTADILGGLAARSLGIPAVSTVHLIGPAASDDPGLRGAVKRRLTMDARSLLDQRVIAVSEAARQAYLTRSPRAAGRVVTVRNGIVARAPARSRAEVRAELGISEDALVAITVTVLRPGKGHAAALEAVGRLHAEHPGLVLLILGDGPSRRQIERLAAPLGRRVVMTGHRGDVPELLAAADVVLHPTDMDAFPTSLLEAAAAGLPTVATAVGGIPEIVVDGRTGLLLNAPTPDAVAAALGRLAGDAPLRARLGAAARERFLDEFAADRWAHRLRQVYEECVAASAG